MARLKSLPQPITVMRERIVLHHQTSPQAVEDFIDCIKAMASEIKQRNGEARKEMKAEGEKLDESEKMVEEGALRKKAVLGY